MAVTSRKGQSGDLDKNKLVSGEDALTLDKKEILYCVGPGDVRELATTKSVNDLLTAVPELYDKLQMLVADLENETLLQGILGDIDANADNLTTHLAEMATRDKLGHIKLQEDWITATLQNGWTGSIRYAKNDLGIVSVKGAVSIGTKTANTVIMALAVGYRLMAGTEKPFEVYRSFDSKVYSGFTADGDGVLRIRNPVSSDSGFSGNIRFDFMFYAE